MKRDLEARVNSLEHEIEELCAHPVCTQHMTIERKLTLGFRRLERVTIFIGMGVLIILILQVIMNMQRFSWVTQK